LTINLNITPQINMNATATEAIIRIVLRKDELCGGPT